MGLSGKHKLQSDFAVWLKLHFVRGKNKTRKQNKKTDGELDGIDVNTPHLVEAVSLAWM